jgi:site-specific recombinase XerD
MASTNRAAEEEKAKPRKTQDLLGHRHITTTRIYDKRRRTVAESASHDVPI